MPLYKIFGGSWIKLAQAEPIKLAQAEPITRTASRMTRIRRSSSPWSCFLCAVPALGASIHQLDLKFQQPLIAKQNVVDAVGESKQ